MHTVSQDTTMAEFISNVTDNFKVEKSATNSAQNSRKWCAEFASYKHRICNIWRIILKTLSYNFTNAAK